MVHFLLPTCKNNLTMPNNVLKKIGADKIVDYKRKLSERGLVKI